MTDCPKGCAYQDCQFTGPETELFQLDGEVWCHYHLPLRGRSGTESPKASYGLDDCKRFNACVMDLIDQASQREEKRAKRGEAQFPEANLRGVCFPGSFVITSRQLPSIAFDGAMFRHGLHFIEVTFGSRVSFGSTLFQGDAELRRSCFRGGVAFTGARFEGKLDCSRSAFHSEASFRDCIFNANSDFSEVAFGLGASFYKAEFKRHAYFFRASFDGYVNFRDVKFHSTSSFLEAAFSREVYFNNALFAGSVSFACAGDAARSQQVLPQAEFRGARFLAGASFINRQFVAGATFADCMFDVAPEFHGCSIHQSTEFPGIESFRDTESSGAVRAYRTLKLSAENSRAREEQAMFYALEQKSQRATRQMSQLEMLLSFLYEKTADYGRSCTLPLVWLVATQVSFFGVYLALAVAWKSEEITLQLVYALCHFTVDQVLTPFRLWSMQSVLPSWFPTVDLSIRVIATVQSLLSVVLIALFVLAVRWKFRR